MNNEQKLIATIGLVLIALVLYGAYRPTLSAILFNAPASNAGTFGGNPVSSAGKAAGVFLNPQTNPWLDPLSIPHDLGLAQVTPTAPTNAPAFTAQPGTVIV